LILQALKFKSHKLMKNAEDNIYGSLLSLCLNNKYKHMERCQFLKEHIHSTNRRKTVSSECTIFKGNNGTKLPFA
jgi:hypothetical protein